MHGFSPPLTRRHFWPAVHLQLSFCFAFILVLGGAPAHTDISLLRWSWAIIGLQQKVSKANPGVSIWYQWSLRRIDLHFNFLGVFSSQPESGSRSACSVYSYYHITYFQSTTSSPLLPPPSNNYSPKWHSGRRVTLIFSAPLLFFGFISSHFKETSLWRLVRE